MIPTFFGLLQHSCWQGIVNAPCMLQFSWKLRRILMCTWAFFTKPFQILTASTNTVYVWLPVCFATDSYQDSMFYAVKTLQFWYRNAHREPQSEMTVSSTGLSPRAVCRSHTIARETLRPGGIQAHIYRSTRDFVPVASRSSLKWGRQELEAF